MVSIGKRTQGPWTVKEGQSPINSSDGVLELMSDIKIITDYQEFRALKDEWNRLLEDNYSKGVWLRHEWYDCWWQAFGEGAKLFVVVIYENGRLTGVIPLMIVRMRIKGMRQRVLQFMENGITPRSGFIIPGMSVEKLKVLLDEIFRRTTSWDLAILNNIAHDDPSYRCAKDSFDRCRVRYVENPQRLSPYIQLSAGWEAVRASFGKRLKRNLSNMTNRLSREGEFALVTFSDASDLPKALSICEEISKRSWKGEAGKDMSGNDSRAKFYRLITAAAMENGWATIWFLKLNDKLIAFEYGLAVDDYLLLLAIDYDLEFRQFSPGTVLRSLVLEQLIGRGITTYDFAGTVYDYKLYWTKTLRPHSQFWVFHSGIKSRILFVVKGKILPAIERMKARSRVTEQTEIPGEDSSDAAS
jgi:CelD/BcsL family acetyltransferase involved in cellulose biosynthesis